MPDSLQASVHLKVFVKAEGLRIKRIYWQLLSDPEDHRAKLGIDMVEALPRMNSLETYFLI